MAGIIGIGIDLVENARLASSLERFGEAFLKRVFREEERAYCGAMRAPAPHYAARFAAKEAVAKAFGTGIGEALGWLDIEVTRSEAGVPGIRLHGAGADLARQRGVNQIWLSLSHTDLHAVAQVILEA